MQSILKLAADIRGNDGPSECSGSIVHALWRYYHFSLTQAGMAPLTLDPKSKLSPAATDWKSLTRYHATNAAEVISDAREMSDIRTISYFKQWSETSLHNFRLYSAFVREFDRVHPVLTSDLMKRHGLSQSNAQFAASKALMLILDRAAGAFASDRLRPESSLVRAVREKTETTKRVQRALANDYQDGGALVEADSFRALTTALVHGRPLTTIKLLAENISEEGYKDLSNNEEPLLSFAVRDLGALKLLISKGAPVNGENNFGKTPLFYAVEAINVEAIKLLLAADADVNHRYKSARDLQGDSYCDYFSLKHTRLSLLMHAARHANTDTMRLLIAAGADLSAKDDQGFNARDHAIQAKKEMNAQFLIRLSN
jgi:uncharacterized protein